MIYGMLIGLILASSLMMYGSSHRQDTVREMTDRSFYAVTLLNALKNADSAVHEHVAEEGVMVGCCLLHSEGAREAWEMAFDFITKE